MGCDYSKGTKRDCQQKIDKLKSQIQSLQSKRQELHNLIVRLNAPEQYMPNVIDIHFELTQRLEKLEEVLRNIHTMNTQTKDYRGDFDESKESSEETIQNGSNHQDSIITNEAPSKREPVPMVDSRTILEDPSIKAMIESKRKILEDRKRHNK